MPHDTPPSPSSSPSSLLPDVSATAARLRAAGCVFAEDEARLLHADARTPAGLDAMAERRAAGHPLEHVLGWAEFCGLRIAVGPGVFVPRRRTEFLVRRAAERAPARGPVVVVDLCCGSGAVGAALAATLEARGARAEVHAADIDPAAVRCARGNIPRVHEGDLFDPLPEALRGRVDVLTANVPYVPTEAVGLLPAEAREHEARRALDGGADGLDVLRRVAAQAPGWLAAGGRLWAETSERQAERAASVLARAGLVPAVSADEELGATVLSGARGDVR
ncbi:putative protein N(5)-glutamine methyltransferase [Streptomyces boncukensis]|uniref:peptide chain release factor N(5)-glutamine methyltransferase n=1 Tax=Streptomyces boncukensis TaxID=2711219 RepID=A0A6G4X8Z6_9ACTN|nr:putative protein N(5)-glutamine methyltransferase [Streptomyces boncukensis]NGO73632.1 putative protein N(5)-glutamine methyltransferase [Streptomyces boncukensis]